MKQDITEKIPFTPDAYQKLQADFDRLTEERKQVMVRLQTAREMGDLSENGAYKYAKFELGSIGRQLRQLRYLLSNGYVQAKTGNSTQVEFGCTVSLKLGTKEVTYLMVSQHESNPSQGKISIESPLGIALMGKKAGETGVFKAPNGDIPFSILKIE